MNIEAASQTNQGPGLREQLAAAVLREEAAYVKRLGDAYAIRALSGGYRVPDADMDTEYATGHTMTYWADELERNCLTFEDLEEHTSHSGDDSPEAGSRPAWDPGVENAVQAVRWFFDLGDARLLCRYRSPLVRKTLAHCVPLATEVARDELVVLALRERAEDVGSSQLDINDHSEGPVTDGFTAEVTDEIGAFHRDQEKLLGSWASALEAGVETVDGLRERAAEIRDARMVRQRATAEHAAAREALIAITDVDMVLTGKAPIERYDAPELSPYMAGRIAAAADDDLTG